jgi:exosortase
MQRIAISRRVFSEKFAQTKGYVSLATMVKILVMSSAILLFYSQDLSAVFLDAFQNECANYVLLVPLILGYFVYRKRKMLNAVIASEGSARNSTFLVTLSGILLCTTAVMLYLYGANTFSPLEYQVITLPAFAAGLVLVLFNLQTLRQLAFPIFFLVFLVPPPSQILNVMGSALSFTGSMLSVRIVSALGIHAEILNQYGNPMIMLTGADKTVLGFTLDLSCSGVYVLLGFLIFGFFMAYITRGVTWKKAVIFLVGIPLMYSLNIVRIASILLIGFSLGQDLALQAFHLLSGFVLTILSIVLLLAIMEKLFGTRIFRGGTSTQACPKCVSPENARAENYCIYCGKSLKNAKILVHRGDIAKILVVTLLVVLMTEIQTPVLATSNKPLPVFVQTQSGEQGNTLILPEISGYRLVFLVRDEDFERLAGEDAALSYLYQSDNETQQTVTVSVELAVGRSSLHNWEECLITYGSLPVKQLDLRDTQILDNPPMTARYFAFEYPNSTQIEVVLYWFDQSTFVIGNETKAEYVKISLIDFPTSLKNLTEAESTLLVFGSEIARYWQPLKTWTAVSLMVSQNGWELALATTVLLAGTIGFGAVDRFRDCKAKGRIYKKLSEEDRLIIDSVRKATENSKATLANVAAIYRETASRELDDEALRQRLIQAEKAGIVNEKIISQSDEPFQTWIVNMKI